MIVRLLRLASIVICLIVIVSFGIFALNQTKSASGRQQEQLSHGAAANTSSSVPSRVPAAHESGAREAIDEASSQLTSPFAGIVSGSSSEWVVRGGELLVALAVYGFGLGYLARVLRIRV